MMSTNTHPLLAAFVSILFIGCTTAPAPAPEANPSPEPQLAEAPAPDDDDEEAAAVAIDEYLPALADKVDVDGGYLVVFSQDGEHRPVEDGVIRLAPRPFKIHVVAPVGVNSYLVISKDPSNYTRFTSGEDLPDILGSPGTGMAEYPFNEKRELFLHDEAASYWNNKEDSQHRFEILNTREGIAIGTRTVERLYHVPSQQRIELNQAAGMTLYVIEFSHGPPMEHRSPVDAYQLRFDP